MSKEYREFFEIEMDVITSQQMRLHSQRPGRENGKGEPIYTTEQSHKNECDINRIIKKYDKTGLISHVSKFEASFGDLSGIDFKKAQDLIIDAKNMFNNLPAEIRKRFNNTPEKLLQFMDNPENRKEAIELGLIDPSWTELTDGLGEHVLEGDNINIEDTE